MGAFVLFVISAGAAVWLWSAFVQRISRGAALALLLLPMLLAGRALLTGGVYSTTDLLFRDPPLRDYARDYGMERMHNGFILDPFDQIVPWQKAVRHALGQGEWPLWNPFILCGGVLAAGMQPAPYDPLHLLGLLLPLEQDVTWQAAMTLFLAALFAFAFVRELGRSEPASVLTAAVYMLSTSMAFTIGWTAHSRSWAYLGLVLFAVHRLVFWSAAASLPLSKRRPCRRTPKLLLLALVLLTLAGHPETLLHLVAIGVAYGLFLRPSLRAVGIALAAGILALLLTAVFVLPFLGAVQETADYENRVVHRDLRYVMNPDIIARRAGAAFLPFYGGSTWRGNVTPAWETGAGRVGSIALALALAALLVAWRRRETWFLFALAVIGIGAYVDAPVITPALRFIPLFDIAVNSRLSFAAAFALGVLAAMAVDEWRHISLAAFAIGLALGLATALVWQSQLAIGVQRPLMQLLTAAELVPLLIIAGVAPATSPASRRRHTMIVLALLCAQRLVEDGGIYPSLPRRTFYPEVPVLAAMKAAEPFRMVGVGATLIPNTSALYGLEDVRGYDAMTFGRLAQTYPLWCTPQPVYFNRVDDLTRPILSMMNVRFALAPRALAPPEGWRVVLDDRDSRLLENTRALPRVFAPRFIRFREDDGQVLGEMSEARDFAEVGWIASKSIPPGQVANAKATLVTRREGNGYEIDATMDGAGWLIVSDSAWKGWRVTIDGRRTRAHYANHAFLGVHVPAGRHRVRLVYRPTEFIVGLILSSAALVIVALVAVRWR